MDSSKKSWLWVRSRCKASSRTVGSNAAGWRASLESRAESRENMRKEWQCRNEALVVAKSRAVAAMKAMRSTEASGWCLSTSESRGKT